MLVAEQQIRRIIGYPDLAKLVIALERRHASLTANTNADRQPTPESDTPTTEEASLTVTDN